MDKIIKARITNTQDYTKGIYITFPTTPDELRVSLKSDNVEDCKIRGFSCESVPPLSRYYDPYITPDEMQYIAVKISTLTTEERDTLSAFLECDYGDEYRTIKTVMDALENLNSCQLDRAVKSHEDLGRSCLEARLETCRLAIEKLAASSDISNHNLADYIKELEKYVDAAAFGRDFADYSDQYITSHGLLSVDWREFFWRDTNDRKVPDEYRLTSKAKPSIMRTLEECKNNVVPAKAAGKPGKNEPEI